MDRPTSATWWWFPRVAGLPATSRPPGYTLSEAAGLSFDGGSNLFVMDGYNARVLVLPITLSASGTPTFEAAVVLRKLSRSRRAAALRYGRALRRLTITDIGMGLSAPVTQVLTVQTKTASVPFESVPYGTSEDRNNHGDQ